MSGHQIQIEILTDEKAALIERVEQLENDLAKQEYRRGLKQRPFWKGEHAVSWFYVTESEFQVAGVSDDHTKYNYVVSQLDEYTTEIVKDVISNPPVRIKYGKIKHELLRRLGEPEHDRIRKLFDEKLDNRTPSQFYRHLQSLAGTTITVDKILRHLWLRRLPPHCQEILASRQEKTNTQLAKLADNIMEVTKASQNSTLNNVVVDNIQQSVDELGKQIMALGYTVKRQARSRSRSSGRARSSSKSPADKSTVCWYHKQWGVNAFRCIDPCSWKQEINNV